MVWNESKVMNTILSPEDWRDVALSSFFGALSYIFADIYQTGEMRLMSLAAFVGVFLGIFILMQILRMFRQESKDR